MFTEFKNAHGFWQHAWILTKGLLKLLLFIAKIIIFIILGIFAILFDGSDIPEQKQTVTKYIYYPYQQSKSRWDK